MENMGQSVDRDVKNWAGRRKFQDFCNKNDICSVMLMADNPFISQYFRLLFRGCKFMSAISEKDAIRKVDRNGGADIVIIDNDLPGAEPSRLRRTFEDAWPKLKVIDVRSPEMASASYSGTYIEKPFDVDSVVRTITTTFGH